MWKSMTYGELELEDIPDKILRYYGRVKMFGIPLQITIGTDSQTDSSTRIVTVIAITCEGHGGIYFYTMTSVKKITNIAQKLRLETQLSLETGEQLCQLLNMHKYNCFMSNATISIHVDASNNPKGKTFSLVPEIVGWIKACGYDCCIKPDSFAASSIADRLTK